MEERCFDGIFATSTRRHVLFPVPDSEKDYRPDLREGHSADETKKKNEAVGGVGQAGWRAAGAPGTNSVPCGSPLQQAI